MKKIVIIVALVCGAWQQADAQYAVSYTHLTPEIMPVGQGFVPIQLPSRLYVQRVMSVRLILPIIVLLQ